jgi:hypothetical protein
MRFSQRKGLTPVKSIIQKDSIDTDLKNGLWNAFHMCLWENYRPNNPIAPSFNDSNLYELFQIYWHLYFKQQLHTLPHYFEDALQKIHGYFFSCTWFQLYDFIEFTAEHAPEYLSPEFISFCNRVLTDEKSAYRIIDKKIVEITAEQEIESINDALENSNNLTGVQTHLKQAISLFSDRKAPDFRNTVKESISAVEAMAMLLTKNDKATLGEALKTIEKEGGIHPALKKGLSSLYGYTSDAEGIRHALLEETNLDFDDAKFMLVACTAFINYLVGKASSAGIKLNG